MKNQELLDYLKKCNESNDWIFFPNVEPRLSIEELIVVVNENLIMREALEKISLGRGWQSSSASKAMMNLTDFSLPEPCPHGHQDWDNCPVCGH